MAADVRIKQNLDTNLLKLVAIVSMFIDHASKILQIDSMILAILGRIAFPLFAYCIVVGCIHTRNFNKYIIRLFIFGVISQPLFHLAFQPTWERFWQEIFALNIFFTLIAGALAVRALMDFKKLWWLLIIPVAMEILIGLDYGFYGIVMMMLFYLFRNNNLMSLIFVSVWMIQYGLFGDFIVLGPINLDRQFFAILALPLIYIHTNFNPKINKYFFYYFYPGHLILLYLLKNLI